MFNHQLHYFVHNSLVSCLYLHGILLNKSVVQELRKRVEVIIHATYSFCKERFISEKRIRDEESINISRTGFKSYPGSG